MNSLHQLVCDAELQYTRTLHSVAADLVVKFKVPMTVRDTAVQLIGTKNLLSPSALTREGSVSSNHQYLSIKLHNVIFHNISVSLILVIRSAYVECMTVRPSARGATQRN